MKKFQHLYFGETRKEVVNQKLDSSFRTVGSNGVVSWRYRDGWVQPV